MSDQELDCFESSFYAQEFQGKPAYMSDAQIDLEKQKLQHQIAEAEHKRQEADRQRQEAEKQR